MVGEKRLELLSLAALVPKTSAYTNSATRPSNYAVLYIIELICPIPINVYILTKMTVSPCISICKMDPETGYCNGCARSSEEKIIWKDKETTNEWKINNINKIQKRMTRWQLKNFKESYDFKIKNGISLAKKKKLDAEK